MMGLCISGDIFQAKVNELLGDIEGLYAYINDILLTTKGTFEEHLQQLRTCFQRFRNAGLKVNAKKCSFGLKEIPYLGYIITLGKESCLTPRRSKELWVLNALKLPPRSKL
jgi:hypothetical protein